MERTAMIFPPSHSFRKTKNRSPTGCGSIEQRGQDADDSYHDRVAFTFNIGDFLQLASKAIMG
jgi:hypothetical protein